MTTVTVLLVAVVAFAAVMRISGKCRRAFFGPNAR